MLRQIQSERNPDGNKKITFNGKTCDFPSLQNPVLHRRQGNIFSIKQESFEIFLIAGIDLIELRYL